MSAAPRLIDVPVDGGDLRVAVWAPAVVERPMGDETPTALLVHGVTSSHLAWSFVADELPDVRLIAPDLRGRGGSRNVGPAGMARHAADLAAVLDRLGIERTLVVGHSMGAFVSVVFAQLYPERVSELILIDGGLPLDVPAGLEPDEMVSHILGPTAARLSMRFGDVGEYLDLWRAHPAFAHDWSPELEAYLVRGGAGALQPATAYATVVDDTVDMNTTTVVTDALAALRHPVRFVSVPRGLQDEPPGLYAADRLPGLLAEYPSVTAERWDGFNHYTVVMSHAGARRVAPLIRAALGD